MPQSRPSLFRLATLGVLVAAFLLAACGRKGPLDLPPANTAQQLGEGQGNDGQQGATTGLRSSPNVEYGADGRPLAPRGPKRKLPGDILID